MAHGACDSCGCAVEENNCAGVCGDPPVLRRPRRVVRRGRRVRVNDWVRITRTALAGAEGHVTAVDGAAVLLRQLNGCVVRMRTCFVAVVRREDVIDG